MSKLNIVERDYYAAKVLNGIYSSRELYLAMVQDNSQRNRSLKTSLSIEEYIAKECYSQADAMIRQGKL